MFVAGQVVRLKRAVKMNGLQGQTDCLKVREYPTGSLGAVTDADGEEGYVQVLFVRDLNALKKNMESGDGWFEDGKRTVDLGIWVAASDLKCVMDSMKTKEETVFKPDDRMGLMLDVIDSLPDDLAMVVGQGDIVQGLDVIPQEDLHDDGAMTFPADSEM